MKGFRSNTNSWAGLIHPEDKERVLKGVDQLMAGMQTNWADEYRFQKIDHTYVNVIDKGFVIRDEKGKAIRMIGAMHDITQHKKEVQHLKLLESVITNTNDAVLITEAEPFVEPGPRIVYVNEAFTKMTGYTAAEVIGKTPRILQGPKTDRNELKRLGDTLKKWETCEITVINYKKNGEEFWINMSISPVADENGWFTHWISIERDVTERKNADLQKMLLTAEISQLFNNPVPLNKTMQQVLNRLAAFGDFKTAEAWLIASDQQRINRVATLSEKVTEAGFYNERADTNNFAKGQGLPGITWASNTMQCWQQESGNDFITPIESEVKAGMVTTYGIPIQYNEQVIGAFILGLSKEPAVGDNHSAILKYVGASIGTEIKRKQLEQELNQLFNFAPDIIFVAGFDGYFKKINPAATRLLEYTEEELVAVRIEEFIHPEDRKKMAGEIMSLTVANGSNYFENRYITKSGIVKWLAWTIQPSFEEGLLFGVAKDITPKKEYEEKIKFHANMLSAVGQAVIATDMEGKIIYWNNAAVKIYGWAIEEVIGKNIKELHIFQQSDEELREIQNQLNEGKYWSGEFIALKKTGNCFPVVVSNSYIHNEQGRLIGSIGVSSDITQLKKNETALKKNVKALAVSNEELEQFAYVASHDLQEPLRMVTSFLGKLEKKYGNVIDDKGKKYIGFAVDGSKRMRQIILDLLEFSRIGRLEYKQEEIDLNDLIAEIKILFRSQIKQKSAFIEENKLPTITAYKAPMRQIFQNLIGNALKYTHSGVPVKIYIHATESVSHWKFSVQDNGIGINEEYFDKIFVIFQRLHNKDDFSGTGIGLAVTKKIIEKQGGTIWVESEEGKGSTFHFTFAK